MLGATPPKEFPNPPRPKLPPDAGPAAVFAGNEKLYGDGAGVAAVCGRAVDAAACALLNSSALNFLDMSR